MERKVARAQGERSQEEKQKLDADIKKAQSELDANKANLNLLITSNKQLQDERRIIERVIDKLNTSRMTLESTIQELILENEMAGVDLSKVNHQKEKTLV